MSFEKTLDLAEQAAPEMVEKTAEAVALLGRVAPEFVPEVLSDFQKVASVANTKVKVAGAVDTAKAVAIGAGGALAASLGAAIASDLYDAAKRGLTKGVNFKRIMDANPNLKHDVEDPKRLKPAFDALHRYAPDFTSDPMVGGALLKSLANMPAGNEHNIITNLISARKNLVETKNKQFSTKLDGVMGGGKQGALHYHQHFEGSGPKGKPLGLKNPDKK